MWRHHAAAPALPSGFHRTQAACTAWMREIVRDFPLPGNGSRYTGRAPENSGALVMYRRPISAETLRKRLRVGAARSRILVAMVRSTRTDRVAIEAAHGDIRRSAALDRPRFTDAGEGMPTDG